MPRSVPARQHDAALASSRASKTELLHVAAVSTLCSSFTAAKSFLANHIVRSLRLMCDSISAMTCRRRLIAFAAEIHSHSVCCTCSATTM